MRTGHTSVQLLQNWSRLRVIRIVCSSLHAANTAVRMDLWRLMYADVARSQIVRALLNVVTCPFSTGGTDCMGKGLVRGIR